MLQMLEKLSAQAIDYQPLADGPTGISNTVDQVVWYLWSKFGDPSLNRQTSSSELGKMTLKAKVDCPKAITTLSKVFCIFGPNLVILAWTGHELSRGQASDWHTQTDKTHTQTQATTIPEGQNWPWVKITAVSMALFKTVISPVH